MSKQYLLTVFLESPRLVRSLMSPAGMQGSLMSKGLRGLPTPSGGYSSRGANKCHDPDFLGSTLNKTLVLGLVKIITHEQTLFVLLNERFSG